MKTPLNLNTLFYGSALLTFKHTKGFGHSYVIHHERSNGSTNLVVGLAFAMRTKQDKQKPTRRQGVNTPVEQQDTHRRMLTLMHARAHTPGRYGDLGQASQCGSLGQTYESYKWFIQEVHFSNQNVRRLGITRNLLHELVLQLELREGRMVEKERESGERGGV